MATVIHIIFNFIVHVTPQTFLHVQQNVADEFVEQVEDEFQLYRLTSFTSLHCFVVLFDPTKPQIISIVLWQLYCDKFIALWLALS